METNKTEFKVWTVYIITLLFANFFHEVGHCIPAWTYGYYAIPTFAKEYSTAIPTSLINYMSLGGILNSVIFFVLGLAFFLTSSFRYRSSLLAGALAMPSIYTLRFILAGRGHDGTEFQEAQSALTFSYGGHFVDWVFVVLLIIGVSTWILKSNPKLKIFGRLIIGAVISVAFIIALQKLNNSIFDPLFSK
jgi:hypothetical protein